MAVSEDRVGQGTTTEVGYAEAQSRTGHLCRGPESLGLEGRAHAHESSVCLEEESGFYLRGDRKPPTHVLKIALVRYNLQIIKFTHVK